MSASPQRKLWQSAQGGQLGAARSARITFTATTPIPASAEAVFDWHEAPGAFDRLTPPSEPVRVLSHVGGIRDGARVSLKVGPGPFALTWNLEHREYQRGRSFSDVQVSGPFRYWRHVHRMIPVGPAECLLEDTIEYELPFGALGAIIGRLFMQRKLKRLFEFRHGVTLRAFADRTSR
jgi:ligand-binding SRPBCC domain-containing protein